MRRKCSWLLPSAMLLAGAGCMGTTAMTGPGYSAISAKNELVRTANDTGTLLETRTREAARIASEIEFLDERIAQLERKVPTASEQDKITLNRQIVEMRDRRTRLDETSADLRSRQDRVLVEAKERFEAARDEMRRLHEDLDAQLR